MMTFYEWETFITELKLSVRTHNLLLRAYRQPSEYQTDKNVWAVYNAFKEVTNYTDFKKIFETVYAKIRGFGIHSYNEVMQALDNLSESKAKKIWHSISKELPPLGIPLMCKVYDTSFSEYVTKYPVYYLKNPYRLNYEWIWLNEQGICTLLPDYSEVREWALIEDLRGEFNDD